MTGRRKNVKERLTDIGLQLFFSNGYNGTGVKEIVDAAGVPKGSFYAYYPSKEALGAAVIERYWAGATARLEPLDKAAAPEARLRQHFELLNEIVIEQEFRNGCLLGNFSTEVAPGSETMREVLAGVFERWRVRLAAVLQEASKVGGLRDGVDPQIAADFLIASWEGAVLKSKVDRSRRPLDHFQAFAFDAILAPTQKS